MKRMIAVFLLLALVVAMSCTITSVSAVSQAQRIESTFDGYQYAITSSSSDWNSYSVAEKVVMLQIPNSELASMSNEDLINALASYPYLVDIYLYGDSVYDGVEIVKTYCSALNELLKRDPTLSSLSDYICSNASLALANSTNATPSGFAYSALVDIFYAVTTEPSCVSPCGAQYVTTPNGTQVPVLLLVETHTAAYHANIDNILVRVYNMQVIGSSSCLYNCHYYAWHLYGNTDADVHKWMNDPSAYMTDGSYLRTYTGNVNAPHYATDIRNGDIIFYGNTSNLETAHSAICIETTVTTDTVKNLACVSKWGTYSVFVHDLAEVPAGYDTSTVSAWRLS